MTAPAAAAAPSPPPSRDLFQYLTTLPPPALRSLYAASDPGGPCCARCVLQRLPELGGQFALRLAAACGGDFPLSLVRMWSSGSRGGRGEANAVLDKMVSLGVIEPLGDGPSDVDLDGDVDGGGEEEEEKEEKMEDDWIVKLTPEFLTAIQSSLSSLKSAPWDAVPRSTLVAAAAAAALAPNSQRAGNVYAASMGFRPALSGRFISRRRRRPTSGGGVVPGTDGTDAGRSGLG